MKYTKRQVLFMIKKTITVLLAILIIFSVASCKPNDDKAPTHANEGYFDQTSIVNGRLLLYGPKTEKFITSGFSEVYSTFEALASSGRLDDLTYAFNYEGDEYNVIYTFIIEAELNDEDRAKITPLSDCISVADKIYYEISVELNGVTCDYDTCTYNHGENTEKTAQFNLIFEDTPNAPRINKSSVLEYKATDHFGTGHKKPNVYEVTADGEILFYVSSCAPITDGVFEFFKECLVQFDGRIG